MISKDATVGIVGAGAMGSGIAQVAATAGHPVLLYDAQPGPAEAAKQKIAEGLSKLVEKGKIDSTRRQEILERIQPAETLESLGSAGLVVEAIVEDLAAKADLFQRLEAIVAQDNLLVSNTSSLSITKLGAVLQHPERFAGWHFFNPAPLMPLVEVVQGFATDPSVTETLRATAEAWGKSPVVLQNAPGFIVNRGARPFYSEPLAYVEELGTTPAVADELLKAQGFKLGPFELIDLVGLDINLSVSRSLWEAYYAEPRYKPSRLVEERANAGHLGRKTGRGFYTYPRTEEFDPSILQPSDDHPPEEIIFYGDLGPAAGLFELCREKGLNVDRGQGEDYIFVDGAKLALTDGRTAIERGSEWITFDLALDWREVSAVGLAAARTPMLSRAMGLFQSLGKRVVPIGDGAGLLCARTICMLINEAFDTLGKGIAGAQEIDTAMQKGLNFPGGPFQWADHIGLPYVLKVLENMQSSTGDPRFRPSPLLRLSANHADRVSG